MPLLLICDADALKTGFRVRFLCRFLKLGNLLEEPITAIWDRYPYKANHYAKYLGASIYTATRAGA